LLNADERDAVCGDLMESGVGAGRAWREVMGLVVRRQAALWQHWRPWLATVTVVLPIGALLSQTSRWWADWSSVYAWLYINNWTWTYLASPGARSDLLDTGVHCLMLCATLFAWSWTGGFVLGALSRSSVWVVGALFGLMVLGATLGNAPAWRLNPANNPVFSLAFYRVIFPLLVRTLLVWLPAMSGMRRSLKRAPLPLAATVVWAAAIVMLTAWSARSLETSAIDGWRLVRPGPGADGVWGTFDDPRPLRLLPVVMVWPAAFMIANAGWWRWRSQRMSAARSEGGHQ
jgi:hypothetical protein